MEVSVAGFDALYRLIGPAGLALCVVALFALYVGLWQLFYMSAVWRNFKHDFLDLEKGRDRCLRDIDPNRANPLIRIIYDIVSTHSHHSDDIRAEVGYLFYRNFKRVSNGLCWLNSSLSSPRFWDFSAPSGGWWTFSAA